MKSNSSNGLTTVLFIIYLIALCWILLFKLGVEFSYMENRRVNLTPFEPIMDLREIISNVLIFVPLGIYTGALFERWNFLKWLLFVVLITGIVESLQYVLAIGTFDTTDLITNTFGGIIGLLVFIAIRMACRNHATAQRVINVFAVIGTVLMIGLLVALKMDMLPVKYR